MYFVYVLRCVDSSLYCGYTTDVAHRIKAHSGAVKGGAKYTKSHPPLSVDAVWECPDKGTALSLEKLIKNLSKQEKEDLVSKKLSLADFFSDKLDVSKVQRNSSFECDIPEALYGNMESVARVP